MQIKKILNEKGIRKNIVSVASNTSLQEVARVLCEYGIGAVLVVTAGTDPPQYIGIASERDMLKKMCTSDNFSKIQVDEIMTRDMIIAKADDDVDYVMQIMAQKHIRHIPILEEDRVIGILSIRDMINSVLKQKNIQIRHLSDYCGSYGNDIY